MGDRWLVWMDDDPAECWLLHDGIEADAVTAACLEWGVEREDVAVPVPRVPQVLHPRRLRRGAHVGPDPQRLRGLRAVVPAVSVVTAPTMQVWTRTWVRSGPACSEADADARVEALLDSEEIVDLVVALPVGVDPRDVEDGP